MTSLLQRLLSGRKSQSTAILAKERLKLVLTHERSHEHKDDDEDKWIVQLKEEIVEVLARYAKIDKDSLHLTLRKNDTTESIEINMAIL